MPLTVEIWSDLVCPWCYIGKRRFEEALERFAHRDEVSVLWRSFELDPNAPVNPEGTGAERLAEKYGMTLERAQAAQQQDDVPTHHGASSSNGASAAEEEVVDAEVVDEQK